MADSHWFAMAVGVLGGPCQGLMHFGGPSKSSNVIPGHSGKGKDSDWIGVRKVRSDERKIKCATQTEPIRR